MLGDKKMDFGRHFWSVSKRFIFEAKINQFETDQKWSPNFFIAINIQKITKRYKIYIRQISDKPPHKFPLTMDNTPPPPDRCRPTIIAYKAGTVAARLLYFRRRVWCQQISAASNCSLSTVALEDVNRSPLNLTNVVDESLSIGNQARGAAATGIKKTEHQDVFTVARKLPILNCR